MHQTHLIKHNYADMILPC